MIRSTLQRTEGYSSRRHATWVCDAHGAPLALPLAQLNLALHASIGALACRPSQGMGAQHSQRSLHDASLHFWRHCPGKQSAHVLACHGIQGKSSRLCRPSPSEPLKLRLRRNRLDATLRPEGLRPLDIADCCRVGAARIPSCAQLHVGHVVSNRTASDIKQPITVCMCTLASQHDETCGT